MSMPYSECRSDLGFASPPVLPPYVFRNRIGCFRLQLSAGRLPLPAADICPPLFLFGRDFCPAVFRFVENPSALQQRSGFSSRPCCLYSAYGSLPGCILLWFGSNRLLDCLLFCGPAPTACPMIRSLAARICRLSDCPLFCGPKEAAPPLLSCGLTRPPLFSNVCGC